MYANAEAIGSNSYNYIYATSLDAAKVKANNEAYKTAYELMDDLTEKDTIKKAMTYYYRTGDTKLVKELLDKKLYTEEEYEVFTEYTEKQTVQTLVGLVGKDVIKSADKTAMAEDWKSTLPTEVKVTVEEEGLETWAICLIIAGSVLVVAAAVIIPVVILSKKKAAREQAEAIKNAYKRPKIDTTDDKSIDVYADDTAEEAPAEEAPVEATEETPNEEVVEAPVEE
jgi:hypothetical protein